jgi:hypothetical protein
MSHALRLPPARDAQQQRRRTSLALSFAPEETAESTALAQGATDAALVLLKDLDSSSAAAVAAQQHHHARSRSSGSLRAGSVLRFSPLVRGAAVAPPTTVGGEHQLLSPLALSGDDATTTGATVTANSTGGSSPAVSLP